MPASCTQIEDAFEQLPVLVFHLVLCAPFALRRRGKCSRCFSVLSIWSRPNSSVALTTGVFGFTLLGQMLALSMRAIQSMALLNSLWQSVSIVLVALVSTCAMAGTQITCHEPLAGAVSRVIGRTVSIGQKTLSGQKKVRGPIKGFRVAKAPRLDPGAEPASTPAAVPQVIQRGHGLTGAVIRFHLNEVMITAKMRGL